MNWQLQDAKNRFSEVVKAAETKGPQVITVRGKETAVVVSMSAFRKMAEKNQSLSEFLRNSPLKGLELSLRNPRDVEYRDIGL
jgi:prevent-host-death family protein